MTEQCYSEYCVHASSVQMRVCAFLITTPQTADSYSNLLETSLVQINFKCKRIKSCSSNYMYNCCLFHLSFVCHLDILLNCVLLRNQISAFWSVFVASGFVVLNCSLFVCQLHPSPLHKYLYTNYYCQVYTYPLEFFEKIGYS